LKFVDKIGNGSGSREDSNILWSTLDAVGAVAVGLGDKGGSEECCGYNKEGDDNDVSVDDSADGGSDGFGMAEIILGESLVRPCLGYVREIQCFQPCITVKR